MARIPRMTDQRQQSRGLPSTGFSDINPATPQGTFGPDLTGAANQVTDMALKARERADTAQVMEADTALTEFENTALYDPEAGALNARGKNAFDVPERVMSEFDDRATEIRSNLNGRQVAAFDKLVAQRRQQMDRTLQRHVASEIGTYEQQQADSLIAGSQVTAANYYNDPVRLKIELGRQRGTIMARAADMGWSPEKTRLEVRKAESTTHGAVIDRMAANDPAAAVRYYAQHGPEMTPADRTAYDKVMRETRTRHTADRVVAGLTGGVGVGADGVWSRMVQQESGGNQFDSNGEPLTSSAGAVGIAQVMPDTAPEAARMAGLEWDEERYRNDAEYNQALGRAYFDAQVDKYGDPMLAAAAYNAGPGNVDAWLDKYGDPRDGSISREAFVQKIPFAQTQGYVRTVARGSATEPLTRSQQMAALNGLPPEVREVANERLDAIWKQQDQQQAELFEAVQLEVEGGTSFHDLPPRAVDNLTADQIKALKTRSKTLAGAEPTMDWGRWTEISTMSREELAQIDDPYTALRPVLDDSHYEKAVNLISDAKGVGDDIDTSATLTFNQRVKNAAMQSGIIPADETPAGFSEEESLKFARFQQEGASRIEAAERQVGRRLTGNEQQEVLDEMLTETILLDDSLFGRGSETYGWALEEDELGDAYVPIDDIPDDDAGFIRNLITGNGRVADNDTVQKAYAQYSLGNRERFQQIIRGQ